MQAQGTSGTALMAHSYSVIANFLMIIHLADLSRISALQDGPESLKYFCSVFMQPPSYIRTGATIQNETPITCRLCTLSMM